MVGYINSDKGWMTDKVEFAEKSWGWREDEALIWALILGLNEGSATQNMDSPLNSAVTVVRAEASADEEKNWLVVWIQRRVEGIMYIGVM